MPIVMRESASSIEPRDASRSDLHDDAVDIVRVDFALHARKRVEVLEDRQEIVSTVGS